MGDSPRLACERCGFETAHRCCTCLKTPICPPQSSRRSSKAPCGLACSTLPQEVVVNGRRYCQADILAVAGMWKTGDPDESYTFAPSAIICVSCRRDSSLNIMITRFGGEPLSQKEIASHDALLQREEEESEVIWHDENAESKKLVALAGRSSYEETFNVTFKVSSLAAGSSFPLANAPKNPSLAEAPKSASSASAATTTRPSQIETISDAAAARITESLSKMSSSNAAAAPPVSSAAHSSTPNSATNVAAAAAALSLLHHDMQMLSGTLTALSVSKERKKSKLASPSRNKSGGQSPAKKKIRASDDDDFVNTSNNTSSSGVSDAHAQRTPQNTTNCV